MKKTLAFVLAFLLALTQLGVRSALAVGNIIYVNDDAPGPTFDGTSWTTAYKRLQNALDAATPDDQIWVAAGVYYPDEGATQINNDPSETFALGPVGLSVYGGFNGTETQLGQRDPNANLTILSGDIDKNDTDADSDNIIEATGDIVGTNSYHVVTMSLTGNDTTLDGFVITAGKGSYLGLWSDVDARGAGMYINNGTPVLTNLSFVGNLNGFGGAIYGMNSSPALSNITFTANVGYDSGGGMYNEGGSPTLSNVTFSQNSANTGGGGGMYNKSSAPSLNTVTFNNNVAEDTTPLPGYTADGGGMVNNESSPTLQNVTFSQNLTDGYGGGMHNYGNSDPTLTNVTFYGNTASLGGGMANMPNLSFGYSDPTLENVTFHANQANQGGGIYASNSNAVVNDALFKGNYVFHDGAGIYLTTYSDFQLTNVTFGGINQAVDYGGAMFITGYSDPTLTNVTISENGASYYGALYIQDNSQPTLTNVLISGNAVGECYLDGTSSLNASSSNNLISDAVSACGLTNGVNGNIIGIAATLGPLQNNGGATETYALLGGSRGINEGANTNCPALDQRGTVRPQGGRCDIGAFELLHSKLTVKSVGSNDGWVLESTETSGVGGTINSTSTLFYVGDGAADKQYVAILHFNTAGLPDTAIIARATLKIKKNVPVGTDPFTILGGLLVDMRTPSFGAVGLAVGDFQTVAGRAGVATFGTVPVSNWYSAILNGSGRNYINKTGTTQFRLRFTTDDNDDGAADYMKFYSGNHANSAVWPMLVIEYYVP